MGIRRLWRERRKLRKLRRDEARTQKQFDTEIEEAKARNASRQELDQLKHQQFWETTIFSDEIDEIITQRLIRKAIKWGIPIPKREEGDAWLRSSQLGTWSLTDSVSMRLRREIAHEVEISQKPWLNWCALIISLFGLIVAVVALLHSLSAPYRATDDGPSVGPAELGARKAH